MSTQMARTATAAASVALLVAAAMPAAARAQDPTGAARAASVGVIRGRVTEAGSGRPLADAQVSVVGGTAAALTNAEGNFVLPRVPAGTQTVRVRRIGIAAVDRTVTVTAGAETRLDVSVQAAASRLDQIVVTALGRTTTERSLGTSQQSVAGPEIAQTNRENFVNALQGRVAGVNVTSSSGVPGASSMITIRGISSISGNNQPLFIVDGLPVDNKTLNTSALGSDAPGSATAFNNRGVDFTNRAADINPEDIESIVVLKGPEAAALYGIDAGNGAIVITTKRGRAGQSSFTYNDNFRAENVRTVPDVQRRYGVSGIGTSTFLYFGAPYADTTTFYNNVSGFFRTGTTQQHNLSFSGAAPDGRVNYRLATGVVEQQGVVPNTKYGRVNLTGASGGQVTSWLNADLSMAYAYATNAQPLKGANGPLLDLLVYPGTDNAANYLTPAGTRRLVTGLAQGSEVDNPYFSINRNTTNSTNGRLIANLSFTITPFSWGNINTRFGNDSYTSTYKLVRSPESSLAYTYNGILDNADDNTRNLNSQTLLNVNRRELFKGFAISGLLGNQVSDFKSTVDGLVGQNFLDPSFLSVNNTVNRSARTTIAQRRLVSAFGQAQFDYNQYLYVTLQGRNDWTSTIPEARNSFFYPSVTSSFIFSDAFPAVRRFMTGKLRAAYAEVGRDARPYAYASALESKTTSYGGYGYGFTGPNPSLKPEFAKSREFGTELGFLQDRLGLDVAVYRKQTQNQIVNDIRGSYATGFILFNLNGANTRNHGVEISLRGTPVRTRDFTWDVLANFDKHHGETLSLPNALPESYVSDTYLIGNIRNGTGPGSSTESLTGLFYLRATQGPSKGAILIDPSTGLPLRSATFTDAGYDRTPKYTVGITNTFRYKRFRLNTLVDLRRGGDVFNATQWYLTTLGLGMNTLDRNTPRVIAGVLRDGRENSATPTPNTIVVVPSVQTGYYQNMSEELFIERNIHWLRLRDVRLDYQLPATRVARSASVFVSGTDLFLKTNYSGLDPIVNGNSAAVGGSSGVGIDYGNFPIPRGINFGLSLGF